MPELLQAASRSGFGKLLSGHDERDVLSLVLEGHAVPERVLTRHPPDVGPQRLVAPRARTVERLVTNGRHHARELRLRLLARLPGDEADDSRHAASSPRAGCTRPDAIASASP